MKKLLAFGVIVLFIGLALSPSIYANESEIPEQSQSQILKSIHKEFWRNPSIRKILFDSSKILQLHSHKFRKDMGDIHLTHNQIARILKLLFTFNTLDFSDIQDQISYSDEVIATYEQVFDGVDEKQMDELSHKFMNLLHPQYEKISNIISQNVGFDVTASEWDFPILCAILWFLFLFSFAGFLFFGFFLYITPLVMPVAIFFAYLIGFSGFLGTAFNCFYW